MKKNNENNPKRPKKTRIRLVNKKSGIAIAGLLGAFVVALIGLSIGSMIANSSSLFSSPSTNSNDSFQLEEVKLAAAHQSNNIVVHNHVDLEVFVAGSKIVVPAAIGIDVPFYRDHSLESFGIRDPPMAPMHTHDSDGMIHIESTTLRDYTLGEFLDIWGMNLEMTGKLTVDGTVVPDYRSHVLKDGQKILLEFSPATE